MIIVARTEPERLADQARRHGYYPTVTSELPDLEATTRAGNLTIEPDRFEELPLDDISAHDLGLWVARGSDPWASPLDIWQRTVKRTLDVVISVALLVVTAPLTIAVAIAIRVDTKGPILHSQPRLGRNGRWFEMHKFRTMRADNDASHHVDYFVQLTRGEAESHDGLYKIVGDPRVTRVGRFLRRFSIDEVPQLLDVLRGSMSVVGPRPMLPRELPTLTERSWARHRVKPGITGLWQVSGRSRTTFDTMIDLDVDYAESWTIRRDVQILLGTPAAILREETA